MADTTHSFTFGDVSFWIEDGTSIQLKAVTGYGDPVELNAEEAREVAQKLLEYATMLDA